MSTIAAWRKITGLRNDLHKQQCLALRICFVSTPHNHLTQRYLIRVPFNVLINQCATRMRAITSKVCVCTREGRKWVENTWRENKLKQKVQRQTQLKFECFSFDLDLKLDIQVNYMYTCLLQWKDHLQNVGGSAREETDLMWRGHESNPTVIHRKNERTAVKVNLNGSTTKQEERVHWHHATVPDVDL